MGLPKARPEGEATLSPEGRGKIGVCNKAEYEVQRRHMMLEWSNIVGAWVAGQKCGPVLIPPAMPLLEPAPAL